MLAAMKSYLEMVRIHSFDTIRSRNERGKLLVDLTKYKQGQHILF